VAIDDLSTTNGGWVHLPAVEFSATTPIYINFTMTLEGSGTCRRSDSTGMPVTIINASGAGLTGKYVINMGLSSRVTLNIFVRNLAIYNKYVGGYLAAGAIKILNVFSGRVEDVTITNFRDSTYVGTGINITSAGTYGCYYNVIDNIYIYNCRRGVVIWGQSGTSYCNSNYLLSGAILGDSGSTSNCTGVLIYQSDTNYIGAVDISGWRYGGSRGLAILGTGTQYNKIIGTRFESNNKTIYLSCTGRNIFIGINIYTGASVMGSVPITDSSTFKSAFSNCYVNSSWLNTIPNAAPETAYTGATWLNTTTGKIGVYTGTNWYWK
jgi:hypothetical protein